MEEKVENYCEKIATQESELLAKGEEIKKLNAELIKASNIMGMEVDKIFTVPS